MKAQETIDAKDYRKVTTESERKKLERKFQAIWNSVGGPPLDSQVAAFSGSKHLFDFGERRARVLFEIHGGIWRPKGAHNTGKAMVRDAYKIRMAAYEGWRLLVFTSDDLHPVKIHEAVQYVRNRWNNPTL